MRRTDLPVSASRRSASKTATPATISGGGNVLAFLAAGLLVAGLAAFELPLLGRRPLANDEATSYFIAHLDWGSFWESLVTSEANGSAFYLALRGWLNVGRSETALRMLPLVFALATIPFLFAVTRRLFGSVAAVFAAAVLSTNVMFVEQAQDLRSYSLATLLVTASTWFFVRGLDDPSRVNRVAHIASSALALYAHFFAAFVLLAQGVSALLYPQGRRSLRFMGWNLAIVVVLAAPLAAFILTGDRGQVDWIPELTVEGVRDALLDLSGMPSTTALILLVVLVVTGIAFACLRHPPAPIEPRQADAAFTAPGWRIGLALSWFVVPIAGALLISVFKPLFLSRYLLVALPGFALLIGVALTSLPQRFLIVATSVGVLVLALVAVASWYSTSPEPGYAGKASYISEHAGPDDAIAFYAPTLIRPFGYYAGYYGNGETLSPTLIYPDRNWLGYSRTRYTPPVERIASDANEYERVWLVTGAARDTPRVAERRTLVEALEQTCKTLTQPAVGIRLFAECST